MHMSIVLIKVAAFLLLLASAEAWSTFDNDNGLFQPESLSQSQDGLSHLEGGLSVHPDSVSLRDISRTVTPSTFEDDSYVHMHGVKDWGDLQGHNVYPPTGGSCSAKHMEIFGFFFQSSIKRKLWNPHEGFNQTKEGWEDFGALSYVSASIAVHPGVPPLVDLIYVDEEYNLKLRTISKHIYSKRTLDLGMQTVDSPLALPLPGDSLAVFARSSHDGWLRARFMKNEESGPVWDKKWTSIDKGQQTISTPTGGVLPDGTIFLFARSKGKSIVFTVKTPDKGWKKWEELQQGGHNLPDVALSPAGGLVITLRDRTGQVYVGFQSSKNGFTMGSLGGPFASDPAIAITSKNHIHIFAADKENDLTRIVWDPKSGWGKWHSLHFENPVIFRPTAFGRGKYAEVFVVQAQSEVRHKTLT